MGSKKKSVKRLERLIRPYGLKIDYRHNHPKIIDEDGHELTVIGGTPNCPHFAENAVTFLVKSGKLPKELRRLKLR